MNHEDKPMSPSEQPTNTTPYTESFYKSCIIVTIYKWFMKLFESNGKVPQPNHMQDDYEVRYNKIKNTAIMKSISICLMGDGSYKVISKGRPDMRLMNYPDKSITKEQCMAKCLSYYKSRMREIESNRIVKEV